MWTYSDKYEFCSNLYDLFYSQKDLVDRIDVLITLIRQLNFILDSGLTPCIVRKDTRAVHPGQNILYSCDTGQKIWSLAYQLNPDTDNVYFEILVLLREKQLSLLYQPEGEKYIKAKIRFNE